MASVYQRVQDYCQSITQNQQSLHGRLFFAALLSINTLAFAYSLLAGIYWYSITLLICIATSIYTFKAFLSKAYRRAYLVSSYVMIVMISTSTFVFGLSSGIQFLFWPLSCWLALNVKIRVYSALVVANICLATFLVMIFYVPQYTSHSFLPYSLQVFLIAGGLIVMKEVVKSRGIYQIGNEKLKRVANIDALTGLYNRRYFNTFLAYQNTIAIREKRAYCLAIGDIDHFKNINDKFGHDAGDKVLVSIAQCFNDYLSKSDAVCRWGGEEFLIYLPESNVNKGLLVLDALRDVISAQDVDGLHVSMSFGLIETDGKQSIETVIKRCDELLYHAKSSGRNVVKIAED